MPEEALFGGDEKAVANGKFNPDLDRRPVLNSGHNILRLDGSALNWRMGERLPFKFANGKILNLRPASFVVLGMLTKIAREHYDSIMANEAAITQIKNGVATQKIQAVIKDFSEIEVNKKVSVAEKKEAKENVLMGMLIGGSETEAGANKQIRDLSYLRKDLGDDGRFLTAQMIFLDATDDEKLLRWKKDKRQPNDEELAAALPRDEYDYDYTGVEIDDLIHVYYQLNFLPTVEKKGFLNLMIP